MSDPISFDLPAKPDLGQQKKRAKDLLKSLKAGDPLAVRRIRYSHPRLADAAAGELSSTVKLSDAQWVIAREYGFSSWPQLKAHIDALNGAKAKPARAFETDIQYYRDRAAGMRSVHSTGERNALRLVRQFHPAFAGSSEAEIRDVKITQEDAELILAREHGFDTWDGLATHVDALRDGKAVEPFRVAFEAIKADDRAALEAVLVAHRGLVNACGTNGNSLLSLALGLKRPELVDALLAVGADPDLANNKGSTALHQAAYGGSLPMVERLLTARASAELEAYGGGGTPLAMALFWGHRGVAERLAQVIVAPRNLRIASALGRLDLMASFFAADGSLLPEAGDHREFHRPHSGFPAWRPSNDRQEILDEALGWAARNNRIEAMAVLLERGARIDAEPYNGTALAWAVRQGHTDAVTWLLDHGADINRRCNFGGVRGFTPLHLAAAWDGKPSCAKLLLERGADATLTDPEHNGTPASCARFFKNYDVAEIIEKGQTAMRTIKDQRAFLPTKDLDRSLDFYVRMGWEVKFKTVDLVLVELGASRLLLQKHYQEEWANNTMVHLVVDDTKAWHEAAVRVKAEGGFDEVRIRPPKVEDYGATVTHVIDPAGVLLHFAEFDR